MFENNRSHFKLIYLILTRFNFRFLGGRLLAQRISVRTVTLIGGVVFLLFAVTSLFMDPNGE